MTVVIRPATRDDLWAIAEVQVQSWRETYTGLLPDALIKRNTVQTRFDMWCALFDRSDHHLWAGCDGEDVVAFSSYGPARNTDDAGEIYAIYVLRRAQGRGLGAQLFRQALGRLKALGYANAVLTVLAANPAVAFYQHMGGRIGETLHMTFDGETIKEWVMTYQL